MSIPGGERGVSAVDVEGEEGAGDDDDVGHEGVREEGREAAPRQQRHAQAAVVGCWGRREDRRDFMLILDFPFLILTC